MRAGLFPQEAKPAAAASAAAMLHPRLPRCPARGEPQGQASWVCPVLKAQGASSVSPPRLPSKMPNSRERELTQLRERQRIPCSPPAGNGSASPAQGLRLTVLLQQAAGKLSWEFTSCVLPGDEMQRRGLVPRQPASNLFYEDVVTWPTLICSGLEPKLSLLIQNILEVGCFL